MSPRLEFQSVSKRYGNTRALDDVSFSVSERQSIGVIGPNGSGKTTAFGVLLGLIRPTHGQVLIDGVAMARNGRPHVGAVGTSQAVDMPRRARARGRLPQVARACGAGAEVGGEGADGALSRARREDCARATVGPTNARPGQRAGPKAMKAPGMAPVQVMAMPQTGP